MDTEQKQILLKAARDAVEAVVKGESLGVIESADPALNANCGCFVTLKTQGRLRGCIGQFTSEIPLIELVAEMTKSSVSADPRFAHDRLTVDELNQLEIEISVLSPLEQTSDPLSLRPGIDGIYIKKGFASGCFLPQVATEAGWSKEEFLSNCASHKAGLSPEAWKDDETEVLIFTADVFSEDDFNRP